MTNDKQPMILMRLFDNTVWDEIVIDKVELTCRNKNSDAKASFVFERGNFHILPRQELKNVITIHVTFQHPTVLVDE